LIRLASAAVDSTPFSDAYEILELRVRESAGADETSIRYFVEFAGKFFEKSGTTDEWVSHLTRNPIPLGIAWMLIEGQKARHKGRMLPVPTELAVNVPIATVKWLAHLPEVAEPDRDDPNADLKAFVKDLHRAILDRPQVSGARPIDE
jgi:hypothetical protein